MKLPNYDSDKNYDQLMTKIKKHPSAVANGDNLDGLERYIINFALEYLALNLKGDGRYEKLYDYVKYNDPNTETYADITWQRKTHI